MKGSRSIIGTAIAIGLLAGSTVAVTAQEEAAGSPAVEFTGHKVCGPQVRTGTDEGGGEGEAVSLRSRGSAWRQTATMSDPRLQGVVYYSEDRDVYPTSAGDVSVANATMRIENDEGAWQGPSVYAWLSDGSGNADTMVLTGEGAYAGLTAIWEEIFDSATCSSEIRGVIIEGEPPAEAEPYMGE